jgi:hypothetical protein
MRPRKTMAVFIDGVPVVVIMDVRDTLTDADIDALRREVRVCIHAGLITPEGDAPRDDVRDTRRVPDPGRGIPARGAAPRPWSGPGTRGSRRK